MIAPLWRDSPLSPRQLAGLACLAVAAPVVSYLAVATAADQSSSFKAFALGLGPMLVVIAWMWPQLAGAAVALMIVSNTGVVLSSGGINPTNLVLGITVLALAAHPAFRRQLIQPNPLLIAFGAFVAARLLSAVVAPSGADTKRVATDLLIGALIIAVLAAAGSRGAMLRRTAETIVAVAALLSILTTLKLLGIVGTAAGYASDVELTVGQQVAQLRSLIPQGDNSRVSGPLSEPNFWAQALVLTAPLALWMVRHGRSRGMQIWGAVGGVLIVTGIIETGSRGGLISLAIAIGCWLWIQGPRFRILLVLLPVVMGIALTFSGAADRLENLRGLTNAREAEDPSIRGRLSENLAAIHMLQDHPLTGIGADQFPANYANYAAEIGLDDRYERDAHDSYLQMAAESGVLGLVAFVGMFVTAFVVGMRTRLRFLERGDLANAGLMEALVAGLLGYSIAAIFLHQAFPGYLWCWFGLIAGGYALARNGMPSIRRHRTA